GTTGPSDAVHDPWFDGDDAGDGSTTATPSGTAPPSAGESARTGAAPVTKVFDEASMRRSVRSMLTDSYDLSDVASVTCPSEQPVEAGARFDCTAVVDGEPHLVPITVRDDDGRYEVGYPEPADGDDPPGT
ncbi:DUF4333 domain-containing protein, partial [Saccharomonospora iraqiensis]|uniref:DUF4333 domain-containing protein n=1 Tax=Saccharomonospora iraqiensis TaxID=52698 RepID=UPI0006873D2D